MHRLPDLDAWAVFAKVVQTGSFTRAAAEFGLSKATVSKTVARLETRLGASLFNRTSRRLSLTDTGRRAAASAARILAEGEAAEADAMSHSVAVRGLVRLAVPMSFGLAHVAPLLPELLAIHPDLTVDMHLGDELVDLVGGGFDIALRIAALANSSLRARQICQIRGMVVGAPAYFASRGRPEHPRDLIDHACLGYTNSPNPDRWRFVHDDTGEEISVAVRGPLRANNGEALMPALSAGLGLAIQPEFVVWDGVAASRLERALPHWSMPPVALNLVTPPEGHRPARISAVMDFLARRLANAPWAKANASAADTSVVVSIIGSAPAH